MRNWSRILLVSLSRLNTSPVMACAIGCLSWCFQSIWAANLNYYALLHTRGKKSSRRSSVVDLWLILRLIFKLPSQQRGTTSPKRVSRGPVGWGCRIHRLHLCRWVRLPPTSVLIYDTKQSDGEASVMLELWGMRSTLSLPSLPGPLWPRSGSTR